MTEQNDRLSISAKVIADSTHDNSRLTTLELTFPRFILAEFNTHRVLSRNSASSRAIPVWKRLVDILNRPFIPSQFGKNKAGMQSTAFVGIDDADAAAKNWLVGRDVAILQAFFLAGGAEQIVTDAKGDQRAVDVCKQIEDLSYHYRDVMMKMKSLSAGIHKQHANRVLEPYAYHTVIVTGTYWRNFYALRASKMAQPEIQELAIAMARAHMESVPRELDHGDWHLPLVFDEDRQEVGTDHKGLLKLARISSARCARVSYLTHDGKRSLDKDFSMADDLQGNGHTSPFEHPATTHDTTGAYFGDYHGNFGSEWMQYRKMLKGEHDFSALSSQEALLEGMKGDKELVDFVLGLRD
jgi:thymidylate synthase ThyX